MKFPRINEYDIALLAVIAWITFALYPSFETSATVNWIILYDFVPLFFLVPMVFFLTKRKLNAFLKVFILLTTWFLVILTFIFLSATVATRDPFGNITFPVSVVQPALGASTLLTLLYSLRRPRVRWFNFVSISTYWAFYMTKGFGNTWATFKPMEFFTGDFLTLVLPMILYLHLVDVRRSESRIIAGIKKLSTHWRLRAVRAVHFAIYVAIVSLGMFLTLDLFFLKLFGTSAYLMLSLELASPLVWLLLSLITVGILVMLPVSIAALVRKIKERGKDDSYTEF